jgi:hypothetical protein
MAFKHSESARAALTRKKRRKWIGTVATAVLVAVLAGVATGLGEKAVDALPSEGPALISVGVEELAGGECGGMSYQPAWMAALTLEEPPPYEADEWTDFHARSGAAPADSSVVQVSIQGESARTITLTDIRFDAIRSRRAPGSTFSAACGDPLTGRGVTVDLEVSPPKVTASSENLEGYVESGGEPGSRTSPIVFPWTVSLTDPLLLYVVANASKCDCQWTAEIPWVSGSEKGVIRIDDGGEPFHLIGIDGLASYVSGGYDWRRLP